MQNDSLFLGLFRYKPSEDISPLENFTTEILKLLLKTDKEALYYFLSLFPQIKFKDEWLRIESQLPTDSGILDILITDDRTFSIVIENKIDAGFQKKQIHRYKSCAELQKPIFVIVLLKTYIDFTEDIGEPDAKVCWFDFARFLEKAPVEAKTKILRNEFIKFLKEENMALDKIEWTLVDGLKQKENLLNMLIKVIINKLANDKVLSWHKGAKASTTPEWNYYAYDVIGTPLYVQLIFWNSEATLYVCLPEKEKKETDEIKKFQGLPPKVLISKFDFSKEHFFPLEKLEQERVLTKFLTDAVKKIKAR